MAHKVHQCVRLTPVICARVRIDAVSSTEQMRKEDGNTCTQFSSRLSNVASSSQVTALFTRVSSVVLSRSYS